MNLFDSAFACYAMHKDAIEAFIYRLARAPEPNDTDTQREIADEIGLNWQALTPDEIEYIERRVSALC
jgi:hypothetical protein